MKVAGIAGRPQCIPTLSAGSTLCCCTLRYRNCTTDIVVKLPTNECLLSLSAKSSVLFDYLASDDSVKSRTAAGGGYVHCLYFACTIGKENERS